MSALLEQGHKNKWQQDEIDGRVWSIWTEPKVGLDRRVFQHHACVPIANYSNVWASLQLVNGVSYWRRKRGMFFGISSPFSTNGLCNLSAHHFSLPPSSFSEWMN